MPSELTQLCDAARRRPLAPRKDLHTLLRGAKVTVLTATPLSEESRLDVWADRDPVLGGVWVPVFSDALRAEAFLGEVVTPDARPLRCASGLAHELFTALLEVPRFGGVRLDPERGGAARLERHDVAVLADGMLPGEAPELHSLDAAPMRLPEGIPCRFGEADPSYGPSGRRAVFPTVPGLTLHDFRCLVELNLGGQAAWVPCRNFASALRKALEAAEETEALEEQLVEALVGFGMYGEAESLLLALLEGAGRRHWALGHLGRVLRRAGRLKDCVAHCEAALDEAPDESRLYRSLTLAHAELEELEAARDAARRGIRRFPDDATLRRFA
ncbi:tetratricopeptide repeat protein [bacterium]|nr:MAG: tetratricopeptide repeat protein [bacterium]